MITFKQLLTQLDEKRGLWDNIHAKRERIKHGSGEHMHKPGSKGAPTAANFKAAQATSESVELDEDHLGKYRRFTQQAQNFKSRGEHQNAKEAEAKAKVHGAAYKKMTGKEPTHLSSESATADAKGYKSSTGGLTQKGRDHYNSTTGSHLKAPVTTPPSKLKAGSKAANRRKSFCARMGGMEGPMRKPNGEPTRKALALRKWNC